MLVWFLSDNCGISTHHSTDPCFRAAAAAVNISCHNHCPTVPFVLVDQVLPSRTGKLNLKPAVFDAAASFDIACNLVASALAASAPEICPVSPKLFGRPKILGSPKIFGHQIFGHSKYVRTYVRNIFGLSKLFGQ